MCPEGPCAGKALILASTASMIDQFNMPNISMLQKMGYKVDVACNFKEGNTCSDARIAELKARLAQMGAEYFQIDFTRSAANIFRHSKAYKQTLRLMRQNKYAFVHCHSPIGGALARLAAKKARKDGRPKVLYTAHGFHFYKGGPLLNWLVYYPIEKYLSRYTDVLVTINKEDYAIAKNKMRAKRTEYIPGVGIDIEKIESVSIDRSKKRAELGLPEDALVLLSVGELSKRKNHEVVIKALAEPQLKGNEKIRYIIAGQGALKDCLAELAAKSGLAERVQLLGFRTDVTELCKAADIFIHPSIREGLGIAPLEGMACGLPLISSYLNGMKDYAQDGVTGCCVMDARSVTEMRDAITKCLSNPAFAKECGERNKKIARDFSLEKSLDAMAMVYKEMLESFR